MVLSVIEHEYSMVLFLSMIIECSCLMVIFYEIVFSKRTLRPSCECQVSSWMSGAAFPILGLLIHYKLVSLLYSVLSSFYLRRLTSSSWWFPSSFFYVGSPISWISSISLSWLTLSLFSSFFRKDKWKVIFKDLIWQKMHVRIPCMSENILTSH